MSRTWFTSDLHLGHRLAVEFRGEQWADTDEMDAAICDGWRAAVRPRDVVWVLGDVALGNTQHGLDLLADLPGRKRLIAGNHDAVWPGHRRFGQWFGRYAEVFETIAPFGRVSIDGDRYLLSHFPYQGDHTDLDRFAQWRLPDLGERLIHGHVHSAWTTRDRMINVGVDVWNYQPVASETVADA